jgi:hypothetical protein
MKHSILAGQVPPEAAHQRPEAPSGIAPNRGFGTAASALFLLTRKAFLA